jgi:HK97 family phage major capsid protein
VASEVAKKLHEQEMRLWHEVKALHAVQVEENRSLTVDEQTKFQALHAEIDTVDKRLRDMLEDEKRAHDTDSAYNEFAGKPRTGTSRQAEERGKQFNAEIRAMGRGERNAPVDAGYAQALFGKSTLGRKLGINMNTGRPMNPMEARKYADEIEQRVIYDGYLPGNGGSFTNNTGAGIVPIDFYDTLISYLIEVSGLMQVGPNVLNTAGGEPIQMPYVTYHTGQTSGGTYVNVSAAQAAALATADPGFGQKTLTSNKFGQLIQIPRELLDDAGIDLLGYLAMSAGRNLGNTLGQAMIGGSGSTYAGQMSNTILGGGSGGATGAPVGVTGALSTAVSGAYGGAASTGAPRYQDLVSLQYKVIAPYRQSRSCYWLAADQSLGTLRQMVDTVGRPIWEPSVVLGAPDLLLGKPIVADPFMPQFGSSALSIAFGDFSQFVVRLVGGVRFERSDDFAFGTDLVSFRCVTRADSQLMNPPSVLTRSQPVVLFQGGAS